MKLSRSNRNLQLKLKHWTVKVSYWSNLAKLQTVFLTFSEMISKIFKFSWNPSCCVQVTFTFAQFQLYSNEVFNSVTRAVTAKLPKFPPTSVLRQFSWLPSLPQRYFMLMSDSPTWSLHKLGWMSLSCVLVACEALNFPSCSSLTKSSTNTRLSVSTSPRDFNENLIGVFLAAALLVRWRLIEI